MKLKQGMTVREAGSEAVEKVIQETAMAYFHANPNVQYNLATPLTVVGAQGVDVPVGPLMCTNGMSPEDCAEEINYSGVCRSYTADVWYNAFGQWTPGFNCSWVGLNLQKNPETVVFDYGGLYFKGENTPLEAPNAYTSENKEEFLKVMRAGLRPGDVILAVPDKSTGNTGHLIMFLGDCFGNGTDYVTHCWPIGGGKWNLETGVNAREPYGASVFQTCDEFLFSEGSSPNWSLRKETMVCIIVSRPSVAKSFQDLPFSDAAVTRYNCPGLVVKKKVSANTYGIVLPGETITVTERFENRSDKEYELTVRECIPEGTSFEGTTGAEKIAGREIFWKVTLPPSDFKEISYDLKVTAEPGTLIRAARGAADTLPTRPWQVRVGASRLSFTELSRLEELRAGVPDSLKGETFEDLAFVKRFYREILNREIALPDTMDGFIKAVFEVAKPDPEFPEILIPKKEMTGEEKKLDRMIVPRFRAGKYFMLPGDEVKMEERIIDALEPFFLPGDVLLTTFGEENTLEAKNPDGIAFHIVLGGGKVLTYGKDGAEIALFKETVERFGKENLAIMIRPTYLS